MERVNFLENIAKIIGVDYISDLRFSPNKERAQRIYWNTKNEYTEKEREDTKKYLDIKEEKEKNI